MKAQIAFAVALIANITNENRVRLFPQVYREAFFFYYKQTKQTKPHHFWPAMTSLSVVMGEIIVALNFLSQIIQGERLI